MSLVTSPAHTRSQSASSTSRSESAAGGGEQLAVERGATRGKVLPDRLVARAGRPLPRVDVADRAEQLAARPDEDDSAVVAAEAAASHPGDLAESPELVEEPGLIAGDPDRQDVALEDRGRQRHAGQLVDHLGEPLESRGLAQRRRRVADSQDALPRRQEPCEGRRIDGLDLLAQAGEGPATEEAQDVRIDPVALCSTGPELAAEDRPGVHAGLYVMDEEDLANGILSALRVVQTGSARFDPILLAADEHEVDHNLSKAKLILGLGSPGGICCWRRRPPGLDRSRLRDSRASTTPRRPRPPGGPCVLTGGEVPARQTMIGGHPRRWA